MPRTQQIIPSYSVPHVMSVINDNSTVDQVANVTASDPAVRFLCIFPSSKGPDGCKTLTSTTEYLSLYGYPDYKKYGQPSYMPYLMLSSGNANVHCMRITPPDSLYANMVIMATVTSTTEGEAPNVSVTFSVESLTDLDDLSTFEQKVDALATTNKYPLIAFASTGRGSYGSMYTVRITSDVVSDNSGTFKNYIVQILSTENGLSPKASYRVSMYPNSVVGRTSHFIYDVVNDPDTGSNDLVAYVSESTIDTIYDAYVTACKTASAPIIPVTQDKFDIFFAKEFRSKTTALSRYTITTDSQNLEVTNGISLLNGSDGNFDMSKASVAYDPTQGYLYADGVPTSKSSIPSSTNIPELASCTTVREAAITLEYVKAFSTLTDTEYMNRYGAAYTPESGTSQVLIDASRRYGTYAMSKRRAPTEIILDANYPDVIKDALIELTLKRGDCKTYLDCGIHNTVSELLAWDANFSGYGTSYKFESEDIDIPFRNISRECQWGKARDPFTGKIINVTYTWVLAQQLPSHIINVGNQVPFTGESYSLVTGLIPNSIRPNIDADDLATKEMLYDRRLNTIDTISENRYMRASQVSVQMSTSDLLEDSNVLVMLEMKRMLEDLTLSKLYDFSEAEDRVRFKADADNLFETYPNRKVLRYEVSFEMNEYEQSRNILHCYLSLVFRQISTTGIVEIDINKRS